MGDFSIVIFTWYSLHGIVTFSHFNLFIEVTSGILKKLLDNNSNSHDSIESLKVLLNNGMNHNRYGILLIFLKVSPPPPPIKFYHEKIPFFLKNLFPFFNWDPFNCCTVLLHGIHLRRASELFWLVFLKTKPNSHSHSTNPYICNVYKTKQVKSSTFR